MRTPFDQFAKQMLRAALAPLGKVETEAEVQAESQRIDILFEPIGLPDSTRLELGLLGKIAQKPCIIELYHRACNIGDLRSCIRKQLTLAHQLKKTVGLPHLWVISAGRPQTVLKSFPWLESADLGAGCCRLAGAFEVGLIVVSELPRNRDTLFLRLLGSGLTLNAALEDLRELPSESAEARCALPAIVQLRFAIQSMDPSERTDDEEMMMRGQAEFEAFVKRTHDEGLAKGLSQGLSQGLTQGVAQGLARVVARRISRKLGRSIDEHEQSLLRQRFSAPDADDLAESLLDLDAQALETWLRSLEQ
jgi:hypothetical protein